MNIEIQEKTERLLRLMSAEGLGGILINSQPNFAWLTAGGTNGVDASRENGVATLFISAAGKRYVLASKIEMARMLDEELRDQQYEPVEFAWADEKANPTLVPQLARSLISQDQLLGTDVSFGNDVRLIEGAMARARYQLTAAEIERFRLLGAEAGEAIGKVARKVAPGLTEREVSRRAAAALAEIDATAVVNLVAADERLANYRHPAPKDTAWEKVLMIVVCARRHGLIASLSRIVCVGQPSEDLQRRLRATAQVKARVLAATTPRALGSDLYEAFASGYRDVGFPGEEQLHHQGGAAGYRTRDWVAHPQCAERVQERQAFAWNPSITGSKVEETCIAFADGVEIITASPGWPAINAKAAGRDYALPDVLVL